MTLEVDFTWLSFMFDGFLSFLLGLLSAGPSCRPKVSLASILLSPSSLSTFSVKSCCARPSVALSQRLLRGFDKDKEGEGRIVEAQRCAALGSKTIVSSRFMYKGIGLILCLSLLCGTLSCVKQSKSAPAERFSLNKGVKEQHGRQSGRGAARRLR